MNFGRKVSCLPVHFSMKAHILQYMPLGVVVEVTDPEYAQFCVPE